MALQRGLAAVRQARTQAESRKSVGNKYILSEGESGIVRFYGNFELQEVPVLGDRHYIERLGNDPYQNCGVNTDQPCTFCYQKEHKDKSVGWPSKYCGFDIQDFRKYHKLETAVRVLRGEFYPGRKVTEADYYMTQYPNCTATKTKQCEFCKMNSQAVKQGFRYWCLGAKQSELLLSQQTTLRDYCRCGALSQEEDGSRCGTLTVLTYFCANPACYQPLEFSPERLVAYCDNCGQTLAPLEQIECSDCGDQAARADISDFLFRVKKLGSKKNTTHTFDVIFPVRPPTAEELAEYEQHKTDFAAFFAPDPPEVQAAKLGLPASPFAPTPGHGAKTYGSRLVPPGAPGKLPPGVRPPQMAAASTTSPARAVGLPSQATIKLGKGSTFKIRRDPPPAVEEPVYAPEDDDIPF